MDDDDDDWCWWWRRWKCYDMMNIFFYNGIAGLDFDIYEKMSEIMSKFLADTDCRIYYKFYWKKKISK